MASFQIGIPLTSTSGLGLSVCMAEGRGFVESIDPQGSVWEWNSNASPEVRIFPGDRIDACKVRGNNIQNLVFAILQVTKPAIHTVTVKSPYGLIVKKRQGSDKAFFVVNSVLTSGSIWKWNKDSPDERVSGGDIVGAVDGIPGTEAEVQEMLSNGPGEEKELMIFHYPDENWIGLVDP